MSTIRYTVILALLLCCAALSAACTGSGNRAANAADQANKTIKNSNSAGTSVEDLRLLINIPYEIEDLAWKEDAAHKKLTAVLRFSAEDSARFVAESEKIRPSEPVNISSETWFPAELTAPSELSGDDELKGRAYAADQFFQEPYTDGRIIRIQNADYFVLQLSTK